MDICPSASYTVKSWPQRSARHCTYILIRIACMPAGKQFNNFLYQESFRICNEGSNCLGEKRCHRAHSRAELAYWNQQSSTCSSFRISPASGEDPATGNFGDSSKLKIQDCDLVSSLYERSTSSFDTKEESSSQFPGRVDNPLVLEDISPSVKQMGFKAGVSQGNQYYDSDCALMCIMSDTGTIREDKVTNDKETIMYSIRMWPALP